jgi:hypothetical protein
LRRPVRFVSNVGPEAVARGASTIGRVVSAFDIPRLGVQESFLARLWTLLSSGLYTVVTLELTNAPNRGRADVVLSSLYDQPW